MTVKKGAGGTETFPLLQLLPDFWREGSIFIGRAPVSGQRCSRHVAWNRSGEVYSSNYGGMTL